MYSAEHLKMVMNMDFYGPKEKFQKILDESGASIDDELI